MRDILVKLYVDEQEKEMIDEMAKKAELPVNRFLRVLLSLEAYEFGYSYEKYKLFNRIYTKRTE